MAEEVIHNTTTNTNTHEDSAGERVLSSREVLLATGMMFSQRASTRDAFSYNDRIKHDGRI